MYSQGNLVAVVVEGERAYGCLEWAALYSGWPPLPAETYFTIWSYGLAYMLASSASLLLSRSTSASRAMFAISIWRMLDINSVHLFSSDVNWFPTCVLNGNNNEYQDAPIINTRPTWKFLRSRFMSVVRCFNSSRAFSACLAVSSNK